MTVDATTDAPAKPSVKRFEEAVVADERAPFQIRDFPIALREEIVKEAKLNDVSVSDFMTGVCIAAREAGWSRAAGPANGLSNGQPPADWHLLLGVLNTEQAPKWLRAGASRRLGMMIGVDPPPPPPKRLRHEPEGEGTS